MIVFKFMLQVLVLQLVVFSIIVFVLYKILKRHLMESAVHQFEVLLAREIDQKLQEIVVVVAGGLPQNKRSRIKTAAAKKLGRAVDLVVEINPEIRGGMIIKADNLFIDCTVTSRLKESGFINDA